MAISIIDKSIDKVSKDFRLRHDLSKWGTVATIISMVPFALTFAVPGLDSGIYYSISAVLFACGLTSAVCLIAYFFLGDSRKAYFKPTHDWMERCELYFDVRNRAKVTEFLSNGDFQGLSNMPRNHSQQYLVILYKAPKGNVVCAQMAKVDECKFIPESAVFVFKADEHNIPQETSLLDFFYSNN